MIQRALIELVVGIAMMLWNRRNAQRGTGLAGTIEQALRGQPPRTLAEVADSVNKNTFLGRDDLARLVLRLGGARDGRPLTLRDVW